ncbi:hypothetical protein SAMN02745823_03906 [Sporobacter termitidis DSM 10068]|uniref:Intracellular proteinase inhibitor n=2 Tax=Sporobacter TaxID=44748 RepID=A0A1M5XR00_9FIRM|nr:hypothetical protein [Sporobacter termitidis]SHI01683.1 hypothetical protein SAMN02745823_01922 [Sporobacter termitidis DSM 10068]SHI25193.1 hypothetical protein SAMN02745823_03906 [Sporobacter termitidis DSM 10068]
MKKFKIYTVLLLLLPSLFLSGCAGHAADKNGDFSLKIYTDKNKYSAGELIDCYATLQYTGNADNATLYVDRPMVVFAVKSSDGYLGGLRLLICAKEEFKKDEIRKFAYEKNGGYDEKSPDWIKEFVNSKDLTLPKGKYTLIADFKYSYSDKGDMETLEAAKTITVK